MLSTLDPHDDYLTNYGSSARRARRRRHRPRACFALPSSTETPAKMRISSSVANQRMHAYAPLANCRAPRQRLEYRESITAANRKSQHKAATLNQRCMARVSGSHKVRIRAP
jgi:hypothetical protein